VKTETKITSIYFVRYKALKSYSVSLQKMNVLVGPNNTGKSTIIRVLRVLEVAMRIARTRKAAPMNFDGKSVWGHRIAEDSLPISLENVHTDYDQSGTEVTFRCSNSHKLRLHFPSNGGCILSADANGKNWRSPSSFATAFPVRVQTVPELGPLEYEELLVTDETIKRGLSTHRASRHFRNYWWKNPDGFDDFQSLISETWPGIEIGPPELPQAVDRRLVMFCTEERMPREIYWPGFGFQIWCQLLTHISRAKNASLLVVDEPEVYLHPDVQRQLIGILRELGPDILVASHSSEIIGESDPSEIVLVDKSKKSASRLKELRQVQVALDSIGSVHNLALAHLARTGRLLYMESAEDSKIIRRFAGVLGFSEFSSGAGVTIIESEGFGSWKKIAASAWAFEKALAGKFKIGAVFDRDYFCNEEIEEVHAKLSESFSPVHIHSCKEVENYLLIPLVLQRAIDKSIVERSKRAENSSVVAFDVHSALERITNELKIDTCSQLVGKRTDYFKAAGKNASTSASEVMEHVEDLWSDLEKRLQCVAGKSVLKKLRNELQSAAGVGLSTVRIINEFKVSEIPVELKQLIIEIDEFRKGA